MDLREKALLMHEENKGKIEIKSKVRVTNKEELSLAYSPGVAEPCKEIEKDINNIYKYTSKGNIVAVITDGTAVLGLGDIGPHASLPVMEGKSILFKEFAGIDSFPICLDTNDTEEIIRTCKLLAPGLGGINLEDICAPKCVEIEQRLIEELDIPVFHDDQHGTAIITSAAVINGCRLTGKKVEDLRVAISGTGAAGSSISKMLKRLGVKTIYAYNKEGIVSRSKYDNYDFLLKELLDNNVLDSFDIAEEDNVAQIIEGADVFVGVSVAGIVTKEMIATMNKDAFVFAMANPNPEILPGEALKGGARVVGTGRSDFPNQVNNVLAFPGIFRGALDVGAKKITEEMKMAAAIALANLIADDELADDYIIPSPFDKRVSKAVAKSVAEEAIKLGIVRNKQL